MDRLTQYQEQHSYFLQSREGAVLARQSGVFRTNCIDCLDRTNVVQSLLARSNLQTVLVRLGVLQDHMRVEHQLQFEQLFKNVWADHADMISIQYSGTGALKTDFTRCEIKLVSDWTNVFQDWEADEAGPAGGRPPFAPQIFQEQFRGRDSTRRDGPVCW